MLHDRIRSDILPTNLGGSMRLLQHGPHAVRLLIGLVLFAVAWPAIAAPTAAGPPGWADDPKPLIQPQSTKARFASRILGLGGSGGFGFFVGDRPVEDLGFVTFEGSFELRIFPDDRFSFDINIDIAQSIQESTSLEGRSAFHAKLYFHRHVLSEVAGYFAAAPFVGLRVYPGTPTTVESFDFGGRIGGEIMSPGGTWGLGIYGRPGLVLSKDPDGKTQLACEVLLELTFMAYIRGKVVEEEAAEE